MSTIFVLGAGFSKPAKFPVGAQLFPEILNLAKAKGEYAGTLQSDIQRFINYKKRTSSSSSALDESAINFEEFISFLDIEHFLGLEGSPWSGDGNLSQFLVRNLIGEVLFNCLEKVDDRSLDLYRYFVSHLKPHDKIITFNYDTLLEHVLDEQDIRYRLFPDRYTNVYSGVGEIDTDIDEVSIIKLHGSIDWFDISTYESQERHYRSDKQYIQPRHIVFSNYKEFFPEKIVDMPYLEGSALQKVYRVKDIGKYYQKANCWEQAPLVISPSFSKLLYLNPLKDLWYGLSKAGGINERVVVIGFSLPFYDEYVRQPLYAIIRNFQNVDMGSLVSKTKLKMIDRQVGRSNQKQYKTNYSFVDWKKCDPYFKGFDKTAVDLIFDL